MGIGAGKTNTSGGALQPPAELGLLGGFAGCSPIAESVSCKVPDV